MIINKDFALPPAHILTVTVVDGTSHVRQLEDSGVAALVTNAAPAVFGPYAFARNFRVQDGGNVSVTIAEDDTAANIPTADQKATLDAIPTVDAEDGVTIWNDGGVLKVSTSA